MRNTTAKYQSLIKGAWLVFAIFVMMCCGPAKKLVELRMNGNAPSIQFIDKKLRTGYREKKEITNFVINKSYCRQTFSILKSYSIK